MEKFWSSTFKQFTVKILENFASVKVWLFLLPFSISTLYMGYILYQQIHLIDLLIKTTITNPLVLESIHNAYTTATETFNAWCVFNVSLTGTIIVVRETFKVSKLRADDDKDIQV